MQHKTLELSLLAAFALAALAHALVAFTTLTTASASPLGDSVLAPPDTILTLARH